MTRRLRRIFLKSLLAAGIIGGVLTPAAYATDGDFDSIVADKYEAELCGWTHDSAPIEAPARHTASRTSANFESSLATMAAAACASAGISVEQIVEPFAMVGPQLSQSLEGVKQFQQWWEQAAAQQSTTTDADPVTEEVSEDDLVPYSVSHVPIVDFDSELPNREVWAASLASAVEDNEHEIDAVSKLKKSLQDELASIVQVDDEEIRQQLDDLAGEEPIDTIDVETAAYGPSVLDHSAPHSMAVDAISEVTSAAPAIAVGSSPMIFSMQEAYMPYDLAVRDLHSGSVFSIAKRPFCIRARMDLPGFDSAFDNYNTSVTVEATEPMIDEPVDYDFVNSGSADCLLDEWIWKASVALEQGGSARKWLRPTLAGQQVAAVVAQHNQIARGLVNRLASVWPDGDRPGPTAGAQLLARAEAVEAGEEPNSGAPAVDAEQLAQATATLKNWLTKVEGAATTMKSRWLPRLAENSPGPAPPGTSRR